jgi:hypothetical protein
VPCQISMMIDLPLHQRLVVVRQRIAQRAWLSRSPVWALLGVSKLLLARHTESWNVWHPTALKRRNRFHPRLSCSCDQRASKQIWRWFRLARKSTETSLPCTPLHLCGCWYAISAMSASNRMLEYVQAGFRGGRVLDTARMGCAVYQWKQGADSGLRRRRRVISPTSDPGGGLVGTRASGVSLSQLTTVRISQLAV